MSSNKRKLVERRYTVSGGIYPKGKSYHPFIRIKGKHLERFGFHVGVKMKVAFSPGRIVLMKV